MQLFSLQAYADRLDFIKKLFILGVGWYFYSLSPKVGVRMHALY